MKAKIKKIKKLQRLNEEFKTYIADNKNSLTKKNIIEFLESKTMQIDTLLSVYLDFVEFLNETQLKEFEIYRENKYKKLKS